MTVHGTESYLPEAIASVMAQTDPDWELVVVDNGGSDAVLAVMEEHLADDRVRLVRQENRGYAGGVSAAAAAASGEYVTVLDSDDMVMPTFVETMAGRLRRHVEVDAVGCDAHLFLDGEDRAYTSHFRSIGHRGPRRGARRLTLRDVLGGTMPFYAGAIRRSAWDACGGYDVARSDVEEDVLLWLRLAAACEVWVRPEKLARCRVRPDSLSRDPEKVEAFDQRMIDTFRRFAASSEDERARAVVEGPIRRMEQYRSIRRARAALASHDVDEARRHAAAAFRKRRTVRTGLIVACLRVMPGALHAIHPLKQRAEEGRRRLTARLRPQGP